MRIWNESVYETIRIICDVRCCSEEGLSKLNDNTLVVGGENVLYIVDIETSEVNKFEDQSLGEVLCLNVLKNGLILLGNNESEIVCYDSSSNKIILKRKFHNSQICCLIKNEDNYLISASEDRSINVYKETRYFKLKRS